MKRLSIICLTIISLLLSFSCKEKFEPDGIEDIRIAQAEIIRLIVKYQERYSTSSDFILAEGDSINVALDDPQYVVWKSSNEKVASVEKGLIVAKQEGSSIISVTTKWDDPIYDFSVNVVRIESVSLSQSQLELVVGETFTLEATVNPATAIKFGVTWSSSDENVATVDQSGMVTAVNEGSAIIAAKIGNKKATCVVTITTLSVESIILSQESLIMSEGERTELTATVIPEAAVILGISWSSSDKTIATVDQNGIITAIKEGTAIITASVGEKEAHCHLTVKNIYVESITLDKTSVSLEKGETTTLIATVNPDNAIDKAVSWATDDESIATVDQNGTLTAVGGGSTIITAKAGNCEAKCTVNVSVSVQSITITPISAKLSPGERIILVATVYPSDATNQTIVWSSSNSNVATVDDYGNVDAKKYGSCTITAQVQDIISTCQLSIVAPDDTWDGSIASSFAQQGSGSQHDPYIITQCSQIAKLAQQVNSGNSFSGKYFTVAANLDFNNILFSPIGTSDHPFSGFINGNGNKMSNITVYEGMYVGTFGCTEGATIDDLEINISIGGQSQHCGGVVGYAKSTTITNCHTSGFVSGWDCTGGLVGYLDDNSHLRNSYSSCQNTLFTIYGSVGGLVGYNCGEISCCYFGGSINAGTYNRNTTGGVVGYNHTTATMSYCYFMKFPVANMNYLNYCGDLNWGICEQCGYFDMNGYLSGIGYLVDILNSWVITHQGGDITYRYWEGIYPQFIY